MSVAHMGEKCACGCTMFLPGTPQRDADGRTIGYRFVCAQCGATMWTTWTEEYEAEQTAKELRESASEARRRQLEEKACAINRSRHAQMRKWMHEMEAWAKDCPAVKQFLDRQIGTYGDMDVLTCSWTYEITGTTYNAARAIMEAVA